MDEIEVVDSEELGVSCQKVEESFEDKNAEVYDTILLNETIETTKNKLKILKDQGSDTRGVFRSFFYFFSVDQTPNCLEFVEWCANNYSVVEEVVMDKPKSRILCPIHASLIQKKPYLSRIILFIYPGSTKKKTSYISSKSLQLRVRKPF